MPGEFQLIDALARDLRTRRARGVVTGIGDDAAVLRVSPREDIVVTTDAMVEGRHFERRWMSWRAVGQRLAAINLSDVAAMGASPRFATISLAVPGNVAPREVRALERGAASTLGRYGAVVVGGNLSATTGPLVADLTLLGTCARNRAWHRDARAGDAIVIAGELGAAAAGVELLRRGRRRERGTSALLRAYRAPVARLEVVAALGRTRSVRGAIDVSDGLSSDLIHLCRAAGVGCRLDAATLPVSRATIAWCRARGTDPAGWALDGGEDYALVLAVSPQRARDVCRRIERAGVRATVAGQFTPRRNIYRVVDADGRARTLRPGGWDHFRSRST
jgi:thiamine-monophosphate kinase